MFTQKSGPVIYSFDEVKKMYGDKITLEELDQFRIPRAELEALVKKGELFEDSNLPAAQLSADQEYFADLFGVSTKAAGQAKALDQQKFIPKAEREATADKKRRGIDMRPGHVEVKPEEKPAPPQDPFANLPENQHEVQTGPNSFLVRTVTHAAPKPDTSQWQEAPAPRAERMANSTEKPEKIIEREEWDNISQKFTEVKYEWDEARKRYQKIRGEE